MLDLAHAKREHDVHDAANQGERRDPGDEKNGAATVVAGGPDGRIALESAAIVERTPEGVLRIPEGTDNVGVEGMASGSLIGMLVGVLGGPVGVLVGWAPAP